MRRLVLGSVDTRLELNALAASIGGAPGSRDRFAYFLLAVEDLRRDGFARRGGQWINVVGQPSLKLYTGRMVEPTAGRPRIWAAVEIVGNALDRLVKSSDGYRGDAADFDGRLADAIDRLRRGGSAPW